MDTDDGTIAIPDLQAHLRKRVEKLEYDRENPECLGTTWNENFLKGKIEAHRELHGLLEDAWTSLPARERGIAFVAVQKRKMAIRMATSLVSALVEPGLIKYGRGAPEEEDMRELLTVLKNVVEWGDTA
mgnify:CR=1 FL=1